MQRNLASRAMITPFVDWIGVSFSGKWRAARAQLYPTNRTAFVFDVAASSYPFKDHPLEERHGLHQRILGVARKKKHGKRRGTGFGYPQNPVGRPLCRVGDGNC